MGQGQFVAEQVGSRGAWIPCDGALTVEFLAPADAGGSVAYTEGGGNDDGE